MTRKRIKSRIMIKRRTDHLPNRNLNHNLNHGLNLTLNPNLTLGDRNARRPHLPVETVVPHLQREMAADGSRWQVLERSCPTRGPRGLARSGNREWND
jgi:hypothetical protein